MGTDHNDTAAQLCFTINVHQSERNASIYIIMDRETISLTLTLTLVNVLKLPTLLINTYCILL